MRFSEKDIPVVSIEQSAALDSDYRVAVDALRRSRQERGKRKDAQNLLVNYKELESSKWRIGKKRALKEWLETHGYGSAAQVQSDLNLTIETSRGEEQKENDVLAAELRAFRENLRQYTPSNKERLEELVLANDMPEDVREAYKKSEAENMVDWLTQEPSDERPGATNDQLAELLEWNIEKTQEIAQNPEKIYGIIRDYSAKIQRAVDDGHLHQNWLEAVPQLKEVVIGDIFDFDYIKNGLRGGYKREHKSLIIWPYEAGDTPLDPHFVGHETTHSLGGMHTPWLNEGLTEKLTSIIDEREPAAYIAEQTIFDTLVQRAPKKVTYRDISQFYIGEDKVQNQKDLARFFEEKYGYDALGAVVAIGEHIAVGTEPSDGEKYKKMLAGMLNAL